MARRVYQEAERAEGLAALEANGGKVKLTARQLGIPPSTLEGWRDLPDNAARPEVRAEKKLDLAERFASIADLATGLILDALNHVASLPDEERAPAALGMIPDLNRVGGTATDKHQLLTGKPTERAEHTFPAEETQHRREMLRESLRVEQGGKKTVVGG